MTQAVQGQAFDFSSLYSLVDVEIQGLVAELTEAKAELAEVKTELAQMKVKLDMRTKEKRDACKEAELTMLHLHQVQEELEHYFVLSRQQSKMLASFDLASKKAKMLLVKISSQ